MPRVGYSEADSQTVASLNGFKKGQKSWIALQVLFGTFRADLFAALIFKLQYPSCFSRILLRSSSKGLRRTSTLIIIFQVLFHLVLQSRIGTLLETPKLLDTISRASKSFGESDIIFTKSQNRPIASSTAGHFSSPSLAASCKTWARQLSCVTARAIPKLLFW